MTVTRTEAAAESTALWAAWQSDRVAAEMRDAVRRRDATIRPLQLVCVDPVHVLATERLDPFWRTTPPPKPVARPVAPVPSSTDGTMPTASGPVDEAALQALVAGMPPMPGHPGEAQVARRWWVRRSEPILALYTQTVTVVPRSERRPGVDAHADLADCTEETRAWALLALDDAGIDSSWWRVAVRLTPWWEVDADALPVITDAPNAVVDPDPVFAALDAVEDAQAAAHRAEADRVCAAVTAWRAARAAEGDPGASNTPYQAGFFIDLGLKLKVADSTAKVLVHTAERLETALPTVWGVFLAGQVPWRAMQAVHAASEGLADAVLPAFDSAAARLITTTPIPRLPDALRRLAERLQPATADERHETAMSKRHVRIEPAADGMGWLTAYLPMVDLVGTDHQLTKQAIAAHGRAGETRGIGALKADLLRDALRGFLRTTADPDDDTLLVAGRRGVEAKVVIQIPAMTALGHATASPILQGYGPIGIKTALKLAGEAKSWIRVLTDPFTGAILDLDRKRYRPNKDMRTLLRLLDGGSRGPGRPRPPDQTDIDHVRSYHQDDEQGRTAIDNLTLLSRSEHGVKTARQAKVSLLRDRTLVWETRAGNRYITRPHDPPTATPIPADLVDPDDCPF